MKYNVHCRKISNSSEQIENLNAIQVHSKYSKIQHI